MKTKNNLKKGIAPLCFLATMLWNCAGSKYAMSYKNQNSGQGPSSSSQPTSSQEPGTTPNITFPRQVSVKEALWKKYREDLATLDNKCNEGLVVLEKKILEYIEALYGKYQEDFAALDGKYQEGADELKRQYREDLEALSSKHEENTRDFVERMKELKIVCARELEAFTKSREDKEDVEEQYKKFKEELKELRYREERLAEKLVKLKVKLAELKAKLVEFQRKEMEVNRKKKSSFKLNYEIGHVLFQIVHRHDPFFRYIMNRYNEYSSKRNKMRLEKSCA